MDNPQGQDRYRWIGRCPATNLLSSMTEIMTESIAAEIAFTYIRGDGKELLIGMERKES